MLMDGCDILEVLEGRWKDGMPDRLRSLLYCRFDIVSYSRYAHREARWYSLHPADIRFKVQPVRESGPATGLLGSETIIRNVWCIP
jgi:hypothetical protein